jgi:transposase
MKGRNDAQLARELRTTNYTVGVWRKRFLARGVDGLFDEPRAGAPRKIADDQIEEVITQTLESTPQGARAENRG